MAQRVNIEVLNKAAVNVQVQNSNSINIKVLNKAAVNVQVQNSNSINIKLPTAPSGLGTPFTADKTEIDQGGTVNFSASKSGLTSLFSIEDFGGFVNKLGEKVSHEFAIPGNFDIALTQADLTQQTSGVQVKRDFVKVNEVPFFLNNDFAQGATAAYSLKLLRAQHSGRLMRVRAEDSGANKGEADVLPRLQPDGSKIIELNSPIENLNSEAQSRIGAPAGGGDKVLADLVDVGGANYDAFVSKWYDQSGNSNDATQSGATNQPQIVSSGSVIKENGKPAIEFDGSDDQLNTNNQILTGTTARSLITVCRAKTVDAAEPILSLNDGSSASDGGGFNFATETAIRVRGGNVIYTKSFLGSQKLGIIIAKQNTTTNDIEFFINNSLSPIKSVNNAAVNTDNLGTSFIGSNTVGGGGRFADINLQELIVYSENKKSNKNKIEENINNHYSIF